MAFQTDEPVLLAIAEGVASHIGNDFLHALVRSIKSAMDVSMAFLTEGIGEPPSRANARFVVAGGKAADSFEYELEGSPCKRVYDGHNVVIPCDVGVLFPVEEGYEGYAGVPFFALEGGVEGHLAVLSREPIVDPEQVERILRIYAMRAQVEIQRMRLEAERERLIASLSRANQRLDRRAAAARAANATKSQLLSLAAHDMRGALQAVSLRSEAILTTLDASPPDTGERIRTAATKTLDAVDRMTDLISGIMERARKETESIPVDLTDADIGSVIHRAVSFNADHAAEKGIRFNVNAPARVTARADEDLLAEALDNLISNAVKYSPARSIVTISVAAEDAGIRISVSDEGPGLTDDDMKKVFGRFQTLSAVPTGGETSTGLGLSLVKSIAEAHGGTAWAENGPRKGACFGIDLPPG